MPLARRSNAASGILLDALNVRSYIFCDEASQCEFDGHHLISIVFIPVLTDVNMTHPFSKVWRIVLKMRWRILIRLRNVQSMRLFNFSNNLSGNITFILKIVRAYFL